MKRITPLLLAAVLILSMLAGCSGGNTPETTAPAEAERPLALGVVEGSTYSNTYAGFGCEPGDDWTVLPADQLQDLPELVQELTEGTEVGEAMKDIQQFTDMLAQNDDEMINMNILFQKLTPQERIAYKLLSEEDILDETLKQKDTMIEAYTSMGMEVLSIDKVTVTFLGEERFALKTVGQVQDVDYYLLQLFDYSLGEYSVTITMTSFVEDKSDTMLELFYPLE